MVAHHAQRVLRGYLADGRVETIIFVDGGSYGARGLNGPRLGKQLTRLAGKPVGVVQLTLAGANHFERHAIMKSLFDNLAPSEVQALKARHVVLLLEINQGYDANPLAQVNEKNYFSERLYGYLTPVNTWYAIKAMRDVSGEVDWKKSAVVAAHAFMNFLNVGVRSRMTNIDDIGSRPGFAPLRSSSEFAFSSLMPVLDQARGIKVPAGKAWIDTIRTPRLLATMRGVVDRVAYYAPPNSSASYLAYARAFCRSHAGEACVDYGDARLLRSIDRKNFWYDKGHLLAKGAVRYTDWLARKLNTELVLGAGS